MKLEKEIFKDMLLDKIYDNAKEYWESKEKNFFIKGTFLKYAGYEKNGFIK